MPRKSIVENLKLYSEHRIKLNELPKNIQRVASVIPIVMNMLNDINNMYTVIDIARYIHQHYFSDLSVQQCNTYVVKIMEVYHLNESPSKKVSRELAIINNSKMKAHYFEILEQLKNGIVTNDEGEKVLGIKLSKPVMQALEQIHQINTDNNKLMGLYDKDDEASTTVQMPNVIYEVQTKEDVSDFDNIIDDDYYKMTTPIEDE